MCKDPLRPGNSMQDYSLSATPAPLWFDGNPTKAAEFWTEMIAGKKLALPFNCNPVGTTWQVRTRLKCSPPIMIGQNRSHK